MIIGKRLGTAKRPVLAVGSVTTDCFPDAWWESRERDMSIGGERILTEPKEEKSILRKIRERFSVSKLEKVSTESPVVTKEMEAWSL